MKASRRNLDRPGNGGPEHVRFVGREGDARARLQLETGIGVVFDFGANKELEPVGRERDFVV